MQLFDDIILPPRCDIHDAREYLQELCRNGAVIGTDEAGRGALAGPVVAAAAVLTDRQEEELAGLGLRDSKRVTHGKREKIFEAMKKLGVKWRAYMVSEKIIDRDNILNASLRAMGVSVKKLAGKTEGGISCVVVDGTEEIPGLGLPQWVLVRAYDLIPCVSAASIAAKVIRDRLMVILSGRYPEYGFAQNKGYPTARHIEAVKRLGISSAHRMTFCRKFLQERGNIDASDKR